MYDGHNVYYGIEICLISNLIGEYKVLYESDTYKIVSEKCGTMILYYINISDEPEDDEDYDYYLEDLDLYIFSTYHDGPVLLGKKLGALEEIAYREVVDSFDSIEAYRQKILGQINKTTEKCDEIKTSIKKSFSKLSVTPKILSVANDCSCCT